MMNNPGGGNCAPIYVPIINIYIGPAEVSENVLYKKIEKAIELRLRMARLYPDYETEESGGPSLRLNLTVAPLDMNSPFNHGSLYSITFEFSKEQIDTVTGIKLHQPAWVASKYAKHDGDPEKVFQLFMEMFDEFLLEYLRVNESECQKD